MTPPLPLYAAAKYLGVSVAHFRRHLRSEIPCVYHATVRKELSGLSMLLKWCKRRGIINALPEFDRPTRKSDHRAMVLKEHEVMAVIDALPKGPIRAYYAIMWALAFRRGTINRLRWDDVDLGRGTVSVRPSADKREYAREDLPLGDRAVAELSALPRGVGLIFGGADRQRYKAFKAAAVAALGARGAKVTNHTIRHSSLTQISEHTPRDSFESAELTDGEFNEP